MRILHTADWHLGRSLNGASFHADQCWWLAEGLPAILRDTRPDLLVVAGDIYDRAMPPAEATTLLSDALDRIIRDLGIPVLLTAGNHDDGQRLAFAAGLLQASDLHIVECPLGRVLTFHDAHGPVAFACAGFGTPTLLTALLGAEPRFADHDAAFAAGVAHLLAQIPAGRRRVYVGHAFVQGGEGCESERPVQIGGGGLVDARHLAGFAYAALGHLHRAQAQGRAAYSGSPLAYSFGEAGQAKSVALVEIGPDGAVTHHRIPIAPPRALRRPRGTVEEILAMGLPREDWLDVTFTERDSTAIHRLREHFPHVLQYRFDAPAAPGEAPAARRVLAAQPLQLIEEFWALLEAGAWGEAEREAAIEALEGLV